MKTVFFGTPAFALSSLEATVLNTNLLGAVTQPDRPRGRGHDILPCEVKSAALAKQIPVFSPASLRKDSDELRALLKFLDEAQPDLFVVTAYGNLLPQSILDRPRFGCINVHASLLPRWRGAAPIQRSLEAGDVTTGVCVQKMVMELDAGDVLAEARIDAGELGAIALTYQLSLLGGELLGNLLAGRTGHFENGFKGQPQDAALVTLAPKIKKEEALWSPEWTAVETHNRVRAFQAWPTVRASLPHPVTEFKIQETALVRMSELKLEPGELCLFDKKVFLGSAVPAGETATLLEIKKITVPGKAASEPLSYFQNLLSKNAGAGGQPTLKILKPIS